MALTLEPKSTLNHYIQRICGAVGKQDVVYTVNQVGHCQFQAIVRLNCLDGQPEYAGEVCNSAKEAEKAAAQQAVQALQLLVESLPTANCKKRKPASTGRQEDPRHMAKQLRFQSQAEPQSLPTSTDVSRLIEDAMLQTGAMPGSDAGVQPLQEEGACAAPALAVSAQQLLQQSSSEAAAAAAGLGAYANPAITDKVRLNSLCMRICKRTMVKGDTVYDTKQVPGGFQSTVHLICLPGEWSSALWAGEVRTNKQSAEQSAAGIALATLEAEPELIELAAAAPSSGKSGRKGKGKGKGRSKSKDFYNFFGELNVEAYASEGSAAVGAAAAAAHASCGALL